ncbi:MAG: hypothetical protein V4465_03090 [Patescibacteria group bacterium]
MSQYSPSAPKVVPAPRAEIDRIVGIVSSARRVEDASRGLSAVRAVCKPLYDAGAERAEVRKWIDMIHNPEGVPAVRKMVAEFLKRPQPTTPNLA